MASEGAVIHPGSRDCNGAGTYRCKYPQDNSHCPGKAEPGHLGGDKADGGCLFNVCPKIEKFYKEVFSEINGLETEEEKVEFIKLNFKMVTVKTEYGEKELIVKKDEELYKFNIGVDEGGRTFLPNFYYDRLSDDAQLQYTRNRELKFDTGEFIKFSDFLDKAFEVLREEKIN